LLYYTNGSVAFTSAIPVGGQHFTHDVAVGLRTPQAAAEEIKKKYGCALTTLVNEQETIEVEGVGGRKPRVVLKKDLSEVLEPRAEETLNLIKNDLENSNQIPLLGSGLVLTGGASQLDGLIEMGEFIFDIPVRRGMPGRVGGLTDVIKSAAFATSVGLILFGWNEMKKTNELNVEPDLFVGWTRKVRDFLNEII
jgi:cell division protein FtsA